MLKLWEDLPGYMKTPEVRLYYNCLKKKKTDLYVKRVFDLVIALMMLILLTPVFIIIATAIILDSRGGPFFCQERVTQYGRKFKIIKFRTMIKGADKIGTQVTVENDMRVTRIGKILRKHRLDELPQLINIVIGDMSFVGTRPEVSKYVKRYTPEMYATLLLPAGVTSEASINYKDEDKLLNDAGNVDDVYISQVLPDKMKYNLRSIRNFNIWREFGILFRTVLAVM